MSETTYKLVAFSRDVNIGFDIAKHTGLALVKFEDGQPVSMKTVEGVGGLIASQNDNFLFPISARKKRISA